MSDDQRPQMMAIFSDVIKERQRQMEKGYTPEVDDKWDPRDFVRFANWRFTPPKVPAGDWFNRQSLIEAIALLVACVEAMDRRAARKNESTSPDQ